MRQYLYDSKTFGKSVTAVGIFCVIIAAYSLFMMLTGTGFFWIPLVISLYQVFNTFISISNPQGVSVGSDSISFFAYGKTHCYKIDEIESLRIRELDQHKKMYVRVNEATIFRGRYWLNCGNMSDGKELWDFLEYLEYQKDPGQLKYRARIPKEPTVSGVGEEASRTDTDGTDRDVRS